jgi:hypothetical protein
MSVSQNLSSQSLFSDTVGGLPEDQQTISPARARAKWNHNLRGIEIIQLGATFGGMEVHCIEDYLDIFISGHTYIRTADNSKWIDTTQKKHKHLEDTDEDGGTFNNILYFNAPEFAFYNFDPVRHGQWFINALNGETSNSTGSCVMKTNAVGGNYIQFINGGSRVSFEHSQMFLLKYELMTPQSRKISFRGGVNVEEVWENPSIRRMYGLQWCDDAGVDRTYQLYSADGSENNAVTTSLSANNDANIVRAIRLDFVPRTIIKMVFEGGAVIASKTDNIPKTLSTSPADTLKFGLKTNENQDKQYRLRTVRFIGKISPNAPW